MIAPNSPTLWNVSGAVIANGNWCEKSPVAMPYRSTVTIMSNESAPTTGSSHTTRVGGSWCTMGHKYSPMLTSSGATNKVPVMVSVPRLFTGSLTTTDCTLGVYWPEKRKPHGCVWWRW